jgi:hypothetical protein
MELEVTITLRVKPGELSPEEVEDWYDWTLRGLTYGAAQGDPEEAKITKVKAVPITS